MIIKRNGKKDSLAHRLYNAHIEMEKRDGERNVAVGHPAERHEELNTKVAAALDASGFAGGWANTGHTMRFTLRALRPPKRR